MDVLLAALLACMAAQTARRGQLIALALRLRHERTGMLLCALALASAANAALSVIAAGVIAPEMTGQARWLLIGIALLSGAIALLIRVKPVGVRDVSRWGGPFLSSLGAFWAVGFGDSAQFIVLALAAKPGVGLAAFLGGTVGGVIGLSGPVLMGPTFFSRYPLQVLARLFAALFAGGGVLLIWVALAEL